MTEPGEKVRYTYQTKNMFCALNENSFLILPDGKTIVGVHKKTEKTLTIEDIITNKASTFGNHEDRIYTLLYHEVTQSLFTGDYTGRIKQYKRGNSTHAFNLVKDYGDVGIGQVLSSGQVGRFALFGGCNLALVAIEVLERWVYNKKIESPFINIFCLQVCHGVDQAVYLSIGGYKQSHFWRSSDFLDVTEVYKYKQEFSECTLN